MVRQIEPSFARKSAASRSHNYLREALDSGKFRTRILDSYLSGSYARDTAISPIDDVDIVVVVDPSGWKRGLFAANPAPGRILQSFASAIRYRYPATRVKVQRRSVRLNMHHLDIDIDVVPAVTVGGDPHRIEIPDADSGDWIVSAPRLHTILATDINQQRHGRFKPTVKLLKNWNSQLPKATRLKSFAVETMAARIFQSVSIPSLQDGVRLFFDFVASRNGEATLHRWNDDYGIEMSWWTQEMLDLADTGSNLLAHAGWERCQRFIESAARSLELLVRAQDARTKDLAVADIRRALRIP